MDEWEIVNGRKSPASPLSPPVVVVEPPCVTAQDVQLLREQLHRAIEQRPRPIRSVAVAVDNPVSGSSRSLPSSPASQDAGATTTMTVPAEPTSPHLVVVEVEEAAETPPAAPQLPQSPHPRLRPGSQAAMPPSSHKSSCTIPLPERRKDPLPARKRCLLYAQRQVSALSRCWSRWRKRCTGCAVAMITHLRHCPYPCAPSPTRPREVYDNTTPPEGSIAV